MRTGRSAERPSSRQRRYTVALRRGLLVVAIAIVALSLVLLIFEVKAGGTTAGAGVTNPVDVRESGESVTCSQDEPKKALLKLEIQSIDIQAQSVTLKAELCATEKLLLSLVDRENRHVAVSSTIINSLRPGWSGESLTVAFQGENVFLEGPHYLRGPTLGHLIKPRNANEFQNLGSIVLPLSGNPARYPFDSYAVNTGILFQSTHERLRTAIRNGAELPFELAFSRGAGVAPLKVVVAHEGPSAIGDTAIGLYLQLGRTALTKWYVLVVLIIPLILELLLCVVLFRAAREGLGPEALVGVAAVLLAILPIRQILVPSGISVLTLVDYGLVVEVAILVAITCLAVRKTVDSDTAPGVGDAERSPVGDVDPVG
jgi:hypothetical protein